MSSVITDNKRAKPALFGILSPATDLIMDSDGHWTSEFDYETLDCVADVDLSSICNTEITVNAIENSGSAQYRTYIPFEIITKFKCSTMSRRPEEIREIAIAASESCTQKALEYELWTGSLAQAAAADDSWDSATRGAFPNRFLASSSATDVTPVAGTPVKTKHGLALLERALASCGCGLQGTIHVTRDVGSALGLKNDDNALVTNLGNTVIAGSGYTGTGPDGTAPAANQAWMYVTGPITVRLGEILVVPDKISQAVDTARNTTAYSVSQPAAVTWNSCCHAAVLVDLSLDYN